ncbi:MAG: AMP-binding protein [Actinomycetota bacterium]|nr:AMP-binding protein [Actinomycetota bacterium]
MQRIQFAPGEQTSPSVLDGGPAPAQEVATLAEVLPRAAVLNRDRAIRLIDAAGVEDRLSYAELLDEASRVLAGLRRAGVRPTDRVVLHIQRHRDLLAAFWGCVLGGFVPVPTPAGGGAPAEVIAPLWHALGQSWVLVDDAAATMPLDGIARSAWLGDVATLSAGEADHDWFDSAPNDVALLTMTAGSSGARKAVALSNTNIVSRSAATIAANDLSGESISVSWMPLDHVGGLVMFHIRDVYLACTQVHAQKSYVLGDPLRWLDLIERYRADTTWGTNSTFDLLANRVDAAGDRSWDLSSLHYIMNGGEAVKARTIRRFLTTLAPFGLAGDAMRPGWGMSETAAGVVDHRVNLATLRDDDRFTPVGTPHPGIRVRVVDDEGVVVPQGTLGTLQIAGASVTAGYAGDEARTAAAFTSDGWLDTGDLGYVNEDLLTVTGSADDALWIDGRFLHGHEIETTLTELSFVDKTALAVCLVDGTDLAVFHHTDDGVDPTDAATRIRELVLSRHGLVVHHVLPMTRDEFPRTGTGKPQRARLRNLVRTK